MAEMRITRFPEQFKKMAEELSLVYGPEFHGCAQVVAGTLMEILGISNDLVLMATSCFAGGAKRCLACGALSGGLMVLGMKYGRRNLEDGAEAQEESLEPAMELVDRFMNKYNTTNCCELTGFDFRDPDQFQLFIDSPEANRKCAERISKVCGWVAEIISRRDNQINS